MLLHGLVLLLLSLIQGPYHGIIVVLVTKHLLHVHQQVLHGDILALIQCVGPFARVPVETGKNMRADACLIILLKEGIHIEPPECVRHFHPQIRQLEDWHIQSCGSQSLLLPTPSAALASMPMDCSLTCSGVPIGVQCSSVWRGRRRASSAYYSALGLRWSSMQMCSPCICGEPSFSHLFHCGGSPCLLGCTSNQLHQRVGLSCIHHWNTGGRVLSLAPQPSAIGGCNSSLPRLHQR